MPWFSLRDAAESAKETGRIFLCSAGFFEFLAARMLTRSEHQLRGGTYLHLYDYRDEKTHLMR